MVALDPTALSHRTLNGYFKKFPHNLQNMQADAADAFRKVGARTAYTFRDKKLGITATPYILPRSLVDGDHGIYKVSPSFIHRHSSPPSGMLALDERDKLLIEAARRFCIGMSDRAAAHYLRGRLIRYRECRWRRTCTELRCPHDAGRLDGMCWHLLKVRDHVPPERLIRLVLSGRKRQSFSEPPP